MPLELDALINVKWDDRYLSVILTEHYPTSISSNSPKPPVFLEGHDGSEFNANILYTSNTSRESTPATTSHRRCSSEQSVRSERTTSPLYSGPFHLVPYVSRQCQTNSLALLNILHSTTVSYHPGDQRTCPHPAYASRLHSQQVNPTRVSSMNAATMAPAPQSTPNQLVYYTVQSDSPACDPNAPAFTPRHPRAAPNEHGARSGQQPGVRTTEGSSSCATLRPEGRGPIIVKTPE